MSKIYTFWSVNGGVGKTTLSIEVAYDIAKKDCNKRVLLLDFNLVNPDVDIHLKMQPTDLKELYKYLITGTLDEKVLMKHIKQYPKQPNFEVLTGLYDINFFDKINFDHFVTILEIAKQIGYDYIFLDIDSSVNIDATFVALTNADKVFVITDGMYHSIRNTNRYCENILSKINIFDKDIELVVNKFDSDISDKREIKKLLSRENVFFIEDNKLVQRAVNQGIPFVDLKDKKAKNLLIQINELVDYIMQLE